METKANYLIVGIGVLLFLAVTAVFVVWIVGFRTDRVAYRIYFERSVAGLSEGAAVRVQGVDVGSVRSINLADEVPARVLVRIRVDPDAPIRTDSKARVKTSGLTGSSYIALSPGSADGERLRPGDGEAPVIPTDESAVGSLLNAAPEALAAVDDLASRMIRLIEDNREDVRGIVADLRDVTAALARHEDDWARTLRESAAAAESVRRGAERAEQVVARAGALLDGLQAALPDAVRAAEGAAVSVRRAAGEAQGLISENRPPVRRFTRDGLLEVRHLVNEARILVDEMQRTVTKFRRDPVDVLLDGDDPGFRPGDR